MMVMDWPAPFTSMPESDLDRVFRYAPQETIVVSLRGDSSPRLWSLSNYDEWDTWFARHRPPMESNSPGLVLVLARRAGENSSLLEEIRTGIVGFGNEKDDQNFLYNIEKSGSHSWPSEGKLRRYTHPDGAGKTGRDIQDLQNGGREAARVPFEKEVFQKLCSSLFIHPSLARVISRADAPLFSRYKIKAGREEYRKVCGGRNPQAFVYNCRTANTWKGDLALTVTSLPDFDLSYGILFGCTADVERQVLNRLSSSAQHYRHPLLLPGIFAELERQRMLKVVEATAKQVNEIVFELDTGAGTYSSDEDKEIGARDERRTVWLDTTFLKNRLNLWRNQLIKMAGHTKELSSLDPQLHAMRHPMAGASDEPMIESDFMIRDRLQDIIDEFQMHMDDCTMRIEGMSMATQWSNGNINVDIASATSKDSSQMRSIALVTMIFLPGTFFATVFSMTFFNWDGSDQGGNVVSGYIWIYFVVTGAFTFLTLFTWWYFRGPRGRKRRLQCKLDSLA